MFGQNWTIVVGCAKARSLGDNMKKRIYYAVCFQKTDKTGRTIGYDDPTKEGAFSLFYHKSDAYWSSNEDDKIVRVLVTIEPVPSNKKIKK